MLSMYHNIYPYVGLTFGGGTQMALTGGGTILAAVAPAAVAVRVAHDRPEDSFSFVSRRPFAGTRNGSGDCGDNGGGDAGSAESFARPRRESSILPGAVVPAHTAGRAPSRPSYRVVGKSMVPRYHHYISTYKYVYSKHI